MCKVIGIDISKANFDVAFQTERSKFLYSKHENKLKGFKELMKFVEPGDHCVMEASGPYYLFLANFLFDQGAKVSVVNPLQIKHFVRMRMTRAKTDKKDAQMIALYGQAENPPLWKPNQEHSSHLRQINSVMNGLQKQLTMVNNQLEALRQVPNASGKLVKTLKSLARTIEGKMRELDQEMNQIAESNYLETLKALTSIPGIGPKTAIMLIAITDNFANFETSKKLASYFGMSPRVYESGTSVKGKGRITKMGNGDLRKLLYLCAWSAKRCNKQCEEMYERLKQKGKPEKVIKMAIANKLLRQAFAIGSSLNRYEKNFALN